MNTEPTLEEYIISVLTDSQKSETAVENKNLQARIKRLSNFVQGVVDVILSHASDPADVTYFTARKAELECEKCELEQTLNQAA